jgi:Immunity protein 35
MLDKETAKKIATDFINSESAEADGENKWVIIDEYTIEKPYGWMFSYNSQKFLETGDYSYSVVGNGPVVVNHYTGEVEEIPGGPFYKRNLEEYEKKIKKN